MTKNTTKLKAIVLSLLMLIGLIPLTSFAQSDGFISNDDDVFGRDAWVFIVNTQNFGATPVGSGLLILGIAGAGYAVAKRRRSKRDIRKGTALLLAGLMLVGMTNCRKKVDTIASVGDKVHITVKVNGGGKAGVNPANGKITFNNGDYLYVGYNGAKVGELTYSTGSSSFGGDITISQSGDQPLYFYYMGGPAATEVDATHYTANISDQTGNYPVIATGPSTTNYEDGTKAYTVDLANKCGLVKFATNVNSTTVNVGGMNTKATLDFSTGEITPGTKGTVSFSTDAEGTGWAILLEQSAVDDATVTASGYSDGTCDVPAVTNNMLYSTGVSVTLTPASGLFTINSSGKQVYFAPGNLQYQASTSTWRFAVNQWDYVGDATNGNVYVGEVKSNNASIASDYSGWIDLFGWGTSGHVFASGYGSAYQPWSTNTTNANYGPTDETSGLTGSFADGDWGVNMGTGWRTLTGGSGGEWEWVLGPSSSPNPGTNCRTSSTIGTTENARYVKATVHGTKGLIIFPDVITWNTTTMGDAPTCNSMSKTYVPTDANWVALEAAGCVFLPAAGNRGGTSVSNVGSYGQYWSSTPDGSTTAYVLYFSSGSVYPAINRNRSRGHSVRLVRDAN